MKKMTFYTLWIFAVLFCASCKQKLTCDNSEGISLIKSNVKSDIVEAWALKLAAEEYKEYKYGWFDMSEDYKTYLLEKLAEIRSCKGEYYELAVQQYIDNEIELENIIPEKYDESIDKCECTANIILTNSISKNKISYDIVRNSEGEITGHYLYSPKAMLDDKTNASDFIKEQKEKFE